MSLITLFVVLCLLLLVFGVGYPTWGSPETPRSGYVGWSPLFLLIVVFLVLWATGVIH